ncbi:uncharacterized protein EV422DRAFT_526711 [Fimicolochytrium jonesii]|uniref:uncharacterized protein n=1 Tax=Fimicolochytrium jonesii TaxID=1396493 RepID=UPI0022FF3C88|nr:uncharacterized protein EV422DRAFT_526711 [Fimicolochytrium jonesii]KAI8821735.1 hypothetical protein EV422DRAFT_526711 [Fimicolochytrium jonesii]
MSTNNPSPPPPAPPPTIPATPPQSKRLTKRTDRRLYTNSLPLILPHAPSSSPHVSPFTFLTTLFATLPPAPPYKATLDSTGCIHVSPHDTDRARRWEQRVGVRTTMRLVKGDGDVGGGRRIPALGLWYGGFFGKATLSRGEMTWWERAWEAVGDAANDDGGGGEGPRQLRLGHVPRAIAGESLATKRLAAARRAVGPQAGSKTDDADEVDDDDGGGDAEVDPWDITLGSDPENHQLMPEEAFFLAHGLGILGIISSLSSPSLSPHLTPQALWTALRAPTLTIPSPPSPPTLSPSDFALTYTAYHHYKSRGWVVKSGIKFGTHFVLYRRGPIFRHAEYAVVVVPTLLTHDHTTPPDTSCVPQPVVPQTTWRQTLTLSRVLAQVNKSVLLCYVGVPADMRAEDLGDPSVVRRLSVWDVAMRRWVPSRTRG